jgi:diguanylate cyclase (GGDEF)-like protein
MSNQPLTVAEKLNRIREAYLKQLPAQLEGIRAAFNDFVVNDHGNGTLEDLHRRIHTLKGASASFGLGRLSAAATTGEELAKQVLQSDAPVDQEWHRRMQDCLTRLGQVATGDDPAPEMVIRAGELEAACENAAERERKVVYLCEDDAFLRPSLATQIGYFGFEVSSFGDLEQMRGAVRNSPPDAIVMDVIFPDRALGGAELMLDIQAERDNPIPTVFISSQNDLTARLSAVRAGSSAYFIKPVNVTDLCSALAGLTSLVKQEQYRVMIVDDEPHLAEYHALILQEAGMLTRTVNDPLQVLSPLFEFQPDLILMDMYMPGCNGMELAKVIRQIGAYFSVPIVFLSSETDADKQFHAMCMGGDEFLTKPIKPHHLVTSVAVRAERMKMIRSLLVRDGMTGLFNHTATKEYLETAIAHAQRNCDELCLAMIDVDRFKQVNDTHGHPTGDRVLISLARLLRQRLRDSDIVGRYGGEEFAVILPDCNQGQAIAIMDQLRESFGNIDFQVGDTTFNTTFSCGVAPLSRFDTAIALGKAADRALYAAKNGGRNRVVAA